MFVSFTEFKTEAPLLINVNLLRYARARSDDATEIIFNGEEENDYGSVHVKGSFERVSEKLQATN